VSAAPAKRTTYREAVREAIREALHRDPRVFMMGEDVGRYGGAYAVSKGLLAEFGPERIRDTPLSESAFVGAGIGAALGGARPIVEVMTVNFSLLALDQIVNNAATLRHMSGGQVSVPLVIRMATGAGRQLAAQHAHSLEGWFAHVPGLRIVVPATIGGCPRHAVDGPRGSRSGPDVRTPDAVQHGRRARGGRRAGGHRSRRRAPARRRRHAHHVWRDPVHDARGRETLAAEGIESEVIDLRTLRPLDMDTIFASVRKTRRVVVIDEGWRSGSLSAEILARVAESAFYDLDAPVARVCSAEVPIPYPKHLEDAALPQAPAIVDAVRALMPASVSR
jgi:pyruvate dehydrogenase E1 component beta subunit